MPLLDSVSVESRRYVAAALSECPSAPNGLVRRLCEEAVEVAAPLLIRSAALTDIDLIALIGRHGMPHARAIARRPSLNKTIADLIRALDGPKLVASGGEGVGSAATIGVADGEPAAAMRSAEAARQQLRSMMLPEVAPRGTGGLDRGLSAYPRLRDTALSGNPAFFQTALADALAIEFQTARIIAEATDPMDLLKALRALDLGPEKAFLIAAAIRPASFSRRDHIRLFLEEYRQETSQAARDWLEGRKNAYISSGQAPIPAAATSRPANQDGRTPAGAKLRAS